MTARATSRNRSFADFETARSRLEDWLLQHAVARSASGDARHRAAEHLLEHGTARDAPSRALYACRHCGSTFTTSAEQLTAECPRCGRGSTPVSLGGGPPVDQTCRYIRPWGQCGYWNDCKACGASVVLCDLELALADRDSRSHTVELLHIIAKASWTYERAATEYERELVIRRLQRSLPAAVDAFLRGQVSHRELSILRVRSQLEAMRERGRLAGTKPHDLSTAELERSFPVETSPEEVIARLLGTVQDGPSEKRRGPFLGLVDPRESPRRAHVDPDRSLLGAIQGHLDAHGFSYGEISRLTPDGEGGSPLQQRGRVKNRLQHRRRAR
jgi:hypothetical protein